MEHAATPDPAGGQAHARGPAGTGGPLAGQVAVVSGGGKGLGRSLCLALARQGALVVVNNRNREVDAGGLGPADHVAAEISSAGGTAVADYTDAADPASGDAIAGVAMDRFGRLDICVAKSSRATTAPARAPGTPRCCGGTPAAWRRSAAALPAGPGQRREGA